MSHVVPLAEARETALYGSKAVGLGAALRAGLRVPDGVALSGEAVEAVATNEPSVVDEVTKAVAALATPFAVRSSAVDEDSAQASFAGQHVTVLNVASIDGLVPALAEIWWSANSDAAISYRQRVGLLARPSVGVVVQSLLDPDVAGVMFTQNPVTGADEVVIEASWGLGETVVAGLVIPDHFRIGRTGQLRERIVGRKQVAIRSSADGGTFEEAVDADLVERVCLDDAQLDALHRLAARCEQIYGPGRDVEWALSGGELYVLQCRAVTTVDRAPVPGPSPVASPDASPEGSPEGSPQAVKQRAGASALEPVPLFAELDVHEREQIARLFKERRFSQGETVIREGSGGAAFYLIGSGEATVLVGGEVRTTLRAGDWFGEIALIDEGHRSATVVASTDLVCEGVTVWDFRPLVEGNGVLGWKLLQALVKKLRAAEGHERTGSPAP